MVLHAPASTLLAVILSGLATPIRALIVGALGAGIAWCWYNDHRAFAVITPLGVVLVGFLISELGVRRLPEHPVAAVHLMPWRILIPSAVAAAAAGLVIIVTVELTVPDKTPAGNVTPTDVKEIVGALSTAITAFLGAAFIDWAADGKDSRVADWIRDVFYAKYDGYFKKNSEGEEAVFTNIDIDGWGPSARMKRAQAIVVALPNDKEPNPPAQQPDPPPE